MRASPFVAINHHLVRRCRLSRLNLLKRLRRLRDRLQRLNLAELLMNST